MSLHDRAHRTLSYRYKSIPPMEDCQFSEMALGRIVVVEWDGMAAMYMPVTGNTCAPYHI